MLSVTQADEIVEILDRRANEVAAYNDEYVRKPDHYGAVELALSREIKRLRGLSDALKALKVSITAGQQP